MTNLFVDLQDVKKSYNRGPIQEVAVESATCQVRARDRIALVGPSGSGKSTLIHLMGGLERPTSGKLSWPGLGSPDSLRPHKIGIVFQMPSLLAPLTVLENVEIPLLLGQVEQAEARKAAVDALERVHLSDIANKLPEELSGGQAQRVAVARALAYRPRLLLADEPTGQLDHPTAQLLMDVLLDSLNGTDTALVMATHDQAVAARLDTIWEMNRGRMEVPIC